MTEFKALGLVTMEELENQNSEREIILDKDRFSWFLTDEFKQLSQKAPPITSSAVIKIQTTHDIIKEEIEKEVVGGIFYDSKLPLFPPKCYRCDFSSYETKQDYESHCVTRHPGVPARPGPADIKQEGLTSQGMTWEI